MASPCCSDEGSAVGLSRALVACIAMATSYVGSLYVPTFLLRLPPASSLRHHFLRRFACASVASLFSLALSLLLLPVKSWKEYGLKLYLQVYGIRSDHVSCARSTSKKRSGWKAVDIHAVLVVVFGGQWQAIVFPLLSTALLYLGPLAMGASDQFREWADDFPPCHGLCQLLKVASRRALASFKASAVDILAWRNYVVAPITEEVVFRACMIPLLLCANLGTTLIIFLSPLFFGLAHLNHFWELVGEQNQRKMRAALMCLMQLGYTTIFGWYAAFWFLRTGHLVAPIVAHIFCNFMGLPDLAELFQEKGLVALLLIGVIGFFSILGFASNPTLYNDDPENCYCWLGYCKWLHTNI